MKSVLLTLASSSLWAAAVTCSSQTPTGCAPTLTYTAGGQSGTVIPVLGVTGKQYAANMGVTSSSFTINGQVITNADPFITWSFGVANLTSSPLTYSFTFVSPYILGPYSKFSASYSSTVTDSGPFPNGSVTIGKNGGAAISTPNLDGVSLLAMGVGCSPPISIGGSASCEAFPTATTGVASAVSGLYGVTVTFVLSANDAFSTTGRVELSQVPEPATLSMAGFALAIGLLGLRRRLV